jgi:hypothetical protein
MFYCQKNVYGKIFKIFSLVYARRKKYIAKNTVITITERFARLFVPFLLRFAILGIRTGTNGRK